MDLLSLYNTDELMCHLHGVSLTQFYLQKMVTAAVATQQILQTTTLSVPECALSLVSSSVSGDTAFTDETKKQCFFTTLHVLCRENEHFTRFFTSMLTFPVMISCASSTAADVTMLPERHLTFPGKKELIAFANNAWKVKKARQFFILNAWEMRNEITKYLTRDDDTSIELDIVERCCRELCKYYPVLRIFKHFTFEDIPVKNDVVYTPLPTPYLK